MTAKRPFDDFDFEGFWDDCPYSLESYVEPPPSDELIASIEKEMGGYRLPTAYVDLARRHNGGMVRRNCHPMKDHTGWAEDHVAIEGLYAIGRTSTYSLAGELGAKLMIEKWRYPPIGIAIADTPAGGHELIMLDYRSCGKRGEPQVVYVDQEDDYSVVVVAPDFETFIRGLVEESEYDTAEEDRAAAISTVERGTLSPIVVRALAAIGDRLPDGERILRALARQIVDEKGFFAPDGASSRTRHPYRAWDGGRTLHTRQGQRTGIIHSWRRRRTRGEMAETKSYLAKEDVESLISRERSAISSARKRASQENWTGIALSGGGIRSAIFCLGALQALADRDALKQFDYMSSVSGGGYIASALQWLWQTDATSSASKAEFPYNTARALINGKDPKDKRLAYIRNHGRYLTPGEGITIWSLGAVIVRTLFLNLAIWIPLGALLLCALISVFGLADTLFAAFPNFFSPIEAKWKCGDTCSKTWPIETFFGVCIAIAMVGIAAFAGWAAAFALDTTASPNVLRDSVPTKKRWLYFALQSGLACLAIAALALYNAHSKLDPFSWSAGIVVVAVLLAFSDARFLQARGADASENYRWRRKMEVYGGAALPILATILAVGTTPILPYLLANEAGPFAKSVAAAVAAIAGVASAVGGHGAQAQNKPPSDLIRWLLMVACGLFLYVLLCVCYILAQLVISPEILVGSNSDLQNITRGMILASSGTAIVLGLRSNVNYVGFHRFYRDRLMEAFMPDAASVEDNVVRPSPDADRLSIASLWPPRPRADGSNRPIPYPIINTNAVFVKDVDRIIASRGGDNFVLTPLFVGARATGWENTQTHIEKNGPMTLASAMAASGAALNANAAYVGAGVTRDRLLSIVMMLMNLRLGLWIGRPSAAKPGAQASMPNQFNPGFRYGVTLSGYKSTSSFIELSDGGHFDNLGIYELARRKSSVILVLDGEQDATSSMPALYSVVQRMQEDFKMNVDLEGRLDDLVPVPFPGYPDGARYVKRPFFVAPLTYEDKAPGVLVYVKLSLASTAGFAAKGYRAQYPDFPHQSTANQFFVAQQVEAYRDVGFANMALALDALGLDKACDPVSILKAWTAHVEAQKATTNTAK